MKFRALMMSGCTRKSIIRKRNKCYVYIQLCGYSITDGIERSPFAIISAQEIDRPKSTKSAFAARRRASFFFLRRIRFSKLPNARANLRIARIGESTKGRRRENSLSSRQMSDQNYTRVWNILVHFE